VIVHDFDDMTARWKHEDIAETFSQDPEDSSEAKGGPKDSETREPSSRVGNSRRSDTPSQKPDPPRLREPSLIIPGQEKAPIMPQPRDGAPEASKKTAMGTEGLPVVETPPPLSPPLLPSRPRSPYGKNLLAKRFPWARILAFSYPRLKDVPDTIDQAKYLDKAASEFLRLLGAERCGVTFDNIPIVLIGGGFGGIVVQKAITLALTPHTSQESTTASSNSKAETRRFTLDQVANIVFLNTPFPVPKDQAWDGFFPANSNPGVATILDKMRNLGGLREGATVDSIWSEFWDLIGDPKQETACRILWFSATSGKAFPTRTVRRQFCTLYVIGYLCQ